MNPNDLKLAVQGMYGKVAENSDEEVSSSCCGGSGCCGGNATFSESYADAEGYLAEADLGLGCGIPTKFAGIVAGNSVLDLGSGAGNDCFVARQIVGETGSVTGLDFTIPMIERANKNLAKTPYENVRFVQGDIENMPFPDASFQVIISNCVLNLVTDKNRAFAEMFRVMKPGGHFCISDIVLLGELHPKLLNDAELYAGCVAGALQKTEYLSIIEQQGFRNVEVKTQKQINLLDDLLLNYFNRSELIAFRKGNTGIYSITVVAGKS